MLFSGETSRTLFKRIQPIGRSGWDEQMTITIAPKGAISDEHSQLLAQFIQKFPFVKVDGSRTYGTSLISNVPFSMPSLHDSMTKLDEDERAMVLAYHQVQSTNDSPGAVPPADASPRVLHPNVLPSVASPPPHTDVPRVSSAASSHEHVLPPPTPQCSPPHGPEPPAKKRKGEPPLAIANTPFMSAEDSSGEEQIPITFLPQWFEVAKLQKFAEQAQLWADTMGAYYCDEAIILLVLVFSYLFIICNKLQFYFCIYWYFIFVREGDRQH